MKNHDEESPYIDQMLDGSGNLSERRHFEQSSTTWSLFRTSSTASAITLDSSFLDESFSYSLHFSSSRTPALENHEELLLEYDDDITGSMPPPDLSASFKFRPGKASEMPMKKPRNTTNEREIMRPRTCEEQGGFLVDSLNSSFKFKPDDVSAIPVRKPVRQMSGPRTSALICIAELHSKPVRRIRKIDVGSGAV
jgi:hypothetical protein